MPTENGRIQSFAFDTGFVMTIFFANFRKQPAVASLTNSKSHLKLLSDVDWLPHHQQIVFDLKFVFVCCLCHCIVL